MRVKGWISRPSSFSQRNSPCFADGDAVYAGTVPLTADDIARRLLGDRPTAAGDQAGVKN